MTFWQNLYYRVFKSGSKLYLLIGINVIVFLLINILSVLEELIVRTSIIKEFCYQYLALPAYLPKLLFRFWTPFTYMFMHDGILHILFNMLWLYWMGQIFEEFLGGKRVLGIYLLGGIAGAFLFVLSYNIIPLFAANNAALFATAVGASASVFAVTVVAATIVPDYTIRLFGIISIRLKWIALFYVLMSFLGVTGPNAGGQIAHLGGALLGFIYVKQLQKGNDWIASIANIFKPSSKLKVASNNTSRTTSSATAKPQQDEIDRILDKISTSGYDKLSKQEKETLFRASNNEEK